ncbi:MAG: Fe-S cluster assembly transcriptional regulator IscR [Legionellaceae bacterium]|nr:Fe-S cluster assembly transcriptional regulator IscR [Legionellaceae bacterium]
MKLTTRGRYAVTAVLDVALNEATGPVSLADISKRQGISQSYLEQLFAKLRREGLLKSARGPGGGYSLACLPKQITVGQVINALDENIDATQCAGKQNCHDGARCLTHQLWTDLSKAIACFLDGVTIESLMTSRDVKEETICRMIVKNKEEVEAI